MLWIGCRARVIRVCAVFWNVLLHIVFSREGLAADWTVDALFPRVLFAVGYG